MIEYVVEESVRPDGAIRWIVTQRGTGQVWSCPDEAKALELVANKLTPYGTVRVAPRNGQLRDYGSAGASRRGADVRKVAAAANYNSTATPTPNSIHPQPAPMTTLMGVRFIEAKGMVPREFQWSDLDQAWIANQVTLAELIAASNTEIQAQIAKLRKARNEGRDVVKATVTNNPRRPSATLRQRKGDLADLAERTQRLVVQIAAMSDSGAIPDGQVAELSKSYAALQSEFDEAIGHAEQIKENLSIMRAIMFEHSDPRNATDAIA